MRSVKDIFRSYAVLDSHGRHTNGTDKESNHSYGDAYERIIADHFGNRESINLMMEVGIADGSSLLAWCEIFPCATCVGFDIEHSDKAHGERIEFHRGNATVRADCERAAAGRGFDMIVDDATHRQADLLRTLLYLWPFVRIGGIYVIEEFEDIQAIRDNVRSLFHADIIGTRGLHIEDEPLVVMKKTKRGVTTF